VGELLSPILEDIEGTLWNFEANIGDKPNYTEGGLRAAAKIFMSTVLDKMYEMQNFDNIELSDRMIMAEKCGEELRKFVKAYTGIDTHELYNKILNKNENS